MVVAILFIASQFANGQQNKFQIPDIQGFYTLKCDFHMHTVYSDGNVWPSMRASEAIRDGLDAISITEHIDYQGYPEAVKTDYNKSSEIARKASEGKNLIVINGVEISPRVPPYHHNALFLSDANKLPSDYMKVTAKTFTMKENIKKEELMGPFLEAKKQDAFVFYNHPGYSWWDKKDTAIFTSFHEELWKNGILQGVEVANSGVYNIIAHKMAMKYNLTMLSNSDEHSDFMRYKDSHRPLTLVFAKEKSEAGIKEALVARRTAVYAGDFIVARQHEAEALFLASLKMNFVKSVRNGEPILTCELTNTSSFTFDVRVKSEYNIEQYPLGQFTIEPLGTIKFVVKELWKYPQELTLNLQVHNFITSPDEFLSTNLKLENKDTTYELVLGKTDVE